MSSPPDGYRRGSTGTFFPSGCVSHELASLSPRDVPIEFKGKVDGTTLKGQFITSRGEREAIGKKVSP